LPFLRALNDAPPVSNGEYGTATLEMFATGWAPQQPGESTAPPAVAASIVSRDADVVSVEVNDKLFRVRLLDRPRGAAGAALRPPPRPANPRARNGRTSSGDDVIAPMHGVVVELMVAEGATVAEGQVVAVIEAMKMMNEIRAHRAGTVAAVHAAKGETVEPNAPLVTLS
jgi:acetyl-CoA/propionyl-CoA carboxylase biotin carboxyl carrier protein